MPKKLTARIHNYLLFAFFNRSDLLNIEAKNTTTEANSPYVVLHSVALKPSQLDWLLDCLELWGGEGATLK